jgi:prophage regulatory protein
MITSPTTEGSLKILRLPQVCEVTGLCRSMIYQMEADLRFPKRVKIGVRAVGWLDNEVQARRYEPVGPSPASDPRTNQSARMRFGLLREYRMCAACNARGCER